MRPLSAVITACLASLSLAPTSFGVTGSTSMRPSEAREIDVGDFDLSGNADSAVFCDATFAEDWALAQSLVPEPAMVGVVIAGLTMSGRRARR